MMGTGTGTTKLEPGALEGVERLTAAVQDQWAVLLAAARKGIAQELADFAMTEAEQDAMARAAAGRSLDRALALIARRVKGEA